MSRERDWVDYAQLGLSAVQTAKLSQISGQMGGMATELCSMRLAAEAQVQMLRNAQEAEAAKARRLSQMRQMVWLAEQFLTRLENESQQQAAQQRSFVYSLQIEDTLRRAAIIPPDRLDDWEDKDRVGALMKKIEEFRTKLANAMGDDQRREAELCWRYMQDDEELDRLIENRSNLEKRETELKAKLGNLEGGSGG